MDATMRSGLVTITEGARALGISRPTMAALIEREGLLSFRSITDRRARFVRTEDIESLKARALVAVAHGNDCQESAGRDLAVA